MRATTRGMNLSAGSHSPRTFSRTDRMLSPDSLRDRDPAGSPKRERHAERNQGIRNDYATGTTQEVLSKITHLCPSAIYRICKGVKRVAGRMPRGPEKNARDEWIRKAYAEDEPVKDIAQRASVSIFRVYQICEGVERKNAVRKERDDRIRAALDRRERPEVVAERESTCVSNVYRIGSVRG